MLNWVGNRQVFAYSGPGPFDRTILSYISPYVHLNPDYDFAGTPKFAIITRSQEHTNLYQQLGGILMPWRYDTGATVTWDSGALDTVTMFSSDSPSHDDMDSVSALVEPTREIKLYNGMYAPGPSGGGFVVSYLSYSKMMVAGLGVWTMPDRLLEPDWRLFDLEQFTIGRQVRGYNASRKGLGELLDSVYELIYRTGRCILGSGHPTGVCTTSNTFVNLRHDTAPFRVSPMGLYAGDTVAVTPVIVAGAVGASGGNPGTVKFTSVGTSDTVSLSITSDTEALYYDSESLSIDKFEDFVNIEMEAPTDGALYVRSYFIWEGGSTF